MFFVCAKQSLKSINCLVLLKINGFQTPFRKDNTSNGGGCIIVYIRNGLMAKRRAVHEEGMIKHLWVEITPTKGKSFLIGTVNGPIG